ncbi:hypothetical protein AJ79_07465 [Helicocarpus griseus UAMH5409]|uniref:Shelterin complex subunit TPP1/Est3 domain-containing protein n=1 Tax=Helicocarpus griseus UAMH5409 TaxID=1447875 RepID=A0A2B7X2L7_9EURO|nr:hypothetical protein AJ79_07465 [Helicocarpus griseus UAMH5409]
METLKPWIAPLVEAALCSCLGEPLPDGLPLRNGLEMVDDGSNFRVRVKDRKFVQVAQWSPASDPIQGTLSDSVTTILTIFSSESTERYRKKTRKQLNKDTRGAILKINEFEIVISYVRAPSPEITLYALDFRVEGCEGTGVFGSPVDISRRASITNMARRCSKRYTTQRNNAVSPGKEDQIGDIDTGPDSESDASSLNSQHLATNTFLASQEHFKSQIPNGRRGESLQAPTTAGNCSAPSKKNAASLLSALKPNSGKQNHTEPPPSAASLARKHHTKIEKSHMPTSGEPDSEVDRMGFATQLVPPAEEDLSSIDEETTLKSNDGVELLDRSKRSTKSPRKHDTSSDSSNTSSSLQKDKAVRDHKQNANVDSLKIATHGEMGPPEQPGIVITKRNDQATDNACSRISIERSHQTTENSTNKPIAQARLKDQWRNMRRIRRRDVTIPKDQEQLIEKQDSWIPPEPGKQAPQAHVPIRLLQEWNEVQRRKSLTDNPSQYLVSQSVGEDDNIEVDLPESSPEVQRRKSSTDNPNQHTASQSVGEDDNTEIDLPESSPEVLYSDWSASQTLVPRDSSPPQKSTNKRDTDPRCHLTGSVVDKKDTEATDNGDDLASEPGSPPVSQRAPVCDTAASTEDEGDGSEMETAVPNGLGNTSQADEDTGDEEIASSGPSLPRPNQVSFTEVEQTPYVRSKRNLTANANIINETHQDAHQEKTKSSSDPLIPSTYDSRRLHVHPETSASTNEKLTQSSAQASGQGVGPLYYLDCDDETLAERQLVSDLDEYTQSTHGEYLDTPNTVHAPGTAVASDKLPSSSIAVCASQLETYPSSRVIGKRKRTELSPRDITSSKQPKISKSRPLGQGPSGMAKSPERRSVTSELRQHFFDNILSPLTAKAKAVYERFKEAYPHYNGSFDQFKEACYKLKSLRDQSPMKTSILWDDFVAQYPDHVTRSQCKESSLIASYENYFYERYFQQGVKKPLCKKRSLNKKHLDVVASQEEENNSAETIFPVEACHEKSPGSNSLVSEHEDAAIEPPENGGRAELVSDEVRDDCRESSIPESNYGELLKNPEVDFEEDSGESCDQFEAHETASVELGDPDTTLLPSDSQKGGTSADEDSDLELEDDSVSDGIDELVKTVDSAVAAPIARRQARSTPLESGSDDDNVALGDSPFKPSLHESLDENRRHEYQTVSEPSANRGNSEERSREVLRSQGGSISPPPRPRHPYRFFYPPPDSPGDPLWSLYNDPRQQDHRDDPDGPEPWYNDPNTQFKSYARSVARLQGDYGFRQDGSRADPIRVDRNSGVVFPPRFGNPRGMDSMGWEL